MMNHLRNILLVTIGFVWLVIGTGCIKDQYVETSNVKPEKRITEFYGSNGSVRPKVINLYKDTVYILDQDISVEAGEQMIIEEGTLVKAGFRDVANLGTIQLTRGSLTIRKGGVLIANGTASEPIIFTSNTVAGTQGVNWGGITIEGNSIDNDLPPGTADISDFSGSLRFLRIEFSNLTLRGVGSGTLIDNILVSYSDRNGRSSFNIYGGTFNAYRLISYASNGPSDFYIANGYSGNMQYIFAYRYPFYGETGIVPVNSLTGIFIENNANNPINARPYTYPVISNLTILGPNDQNGLTPYYRDTTIKAAAIVGSNSASFLIRNSAFLGCLQTCFIIDDAVTAEKLRDRESMISHSYFHAVDSSKPFSIRPGVLGDFDHEDLKGFLLAPDLENKLLYSLAPFSFQDLYAYNQSAPLPGPNSIILNGADFSDVFANASIFTKGSFIGAFGLDDWTKNWINFQPLKTNYNFPQ